MRYDQLDTLLGSRQERTVQGKRATRIVRHGDDIVVQYHGTSVVRAHQDGTFTLHTGGYRTSTTKVRINDWSPARVWQDKGVWWVAGRNQDGTFDFSREGRARFVEAMVVGPDGAPVVEAVAK